MMARSAKVLWMVYFVILTLSALTSASVATRQLGIGWLSTPGHVACIANTDVVLNWMYTAIGRSNVKWTYKGKHGDPESLLLMDSDNEGTTYIVQNTPWSSRLEHTNTPGSAVMVIRNVTSADEGIYECDIYGFEQKQDISDVATLAVISDDAFTFNVTIANLTFEFSLAENGSNINLPGSIVIFPTASDIGARATLSAPHEITSCIQLQLGNHKYDEQCCVRNSTCPRYELRNKTHFMDQQLDMLMVIRFNIQNLDLIHIRSKVVFANTDDSVQEASGTRTKSTLIVVIVVGILCCFLGVGIAIFAVRRKKICTQYGRVQKNEDNDDVTTNDAETSFITQEFMGITSPDRISRHILRDLTVAEYVFCFDGAILIPSDRLPEGNQTMCELLASMTALLNTCGGLIIIKNVNYESFISLNNIIKTFIRTRMLLSREFVKKYVFFSLEGNTMHVIVPKSPRPGVYKYNAYTRDSSGRKEVNDNGTAKRILGQTEDDVDLKASRITVHIEPGEYKLSFKLDHSEHSELLKEVNSLQNVYAGGYLELEDQCVNDSSDEEIRSNIENALRLAFNEIAGKCSVCPETSMRHGPPKSDQQWTLMSMGTQKEANFAIKVKEHQGGAFLKCLECFIIHDTGTVMAHDFDELRYMIEAGQQSSSQADRHTQVQSSSQTDGHIQAQSSSQADRHIQAQSSSQADGHIQAQSSSQADGHIQEKSSRQADRHTDAQSSSQSDQHTSAQSLSQADRHIHANSSSKADRHTEAQSSSQADQHTEAQSSSQADRLTEAQSLSQADRHPEAQSSSQADQHTEASPLEPLPTGRDQQKDESCLLYDNEYILSSAFQMDIPLIGTPAYDRIYNKLKTTNPILSNNFEQLCSQASGWLIALPSILQSLGGNTGIIAPSYFIMDLLIATAGNPLKLVTVSTRNPNKETKLYLLLSARILKKRLSQQLKGHEFTEQLHVDVFCLSHEDCTDVEDRNLKAELHKAYTRRVQIDDVFLNRALTKCLKLPRTGNRE